MTYVNYVRDRETADVHVLATRMRTAVGSFIFTFDFMGQNEFANLIYLLELDEIPNISRLERTQALVNVLPINEQPT